MPTEQFYTARWANFLSGRMLRLILISPSEPFGSRKSPNFARFGVDLTDRIDRYRPTKRSITLHSLAEAGLARDQSTCFLNFVLVQR